MRLPSLFPEARHIALAATRTGVVERRQALSGSVFRSCLIAGIATNGAMSVVRTLMQPSDWLRLLLIWTISALIVLPLVFLSLRSITAAGILFIGCFMGLINVLMFVSKDASITTPMGFTTIILLAGFTFGRSGTLITLVLSSMSVLLWSFLAIPAAPSSADSRLFGLLTAYHFLNLAMYSIFYMGVMETSLGAALDGQAREQALSAQLTATNEQLEKKVEARTASLQEANEEMLAMNEELIAANEMVTSMNSELTEKNAALSTQYEELRLMQRQVIASEKMASLGTLVSGMAHEINTPLGNSLTALSFMMGELHAATGVDDAGTSADTTSPVLRSARIVQSNLNRAAALVRSLKTISADQHADDLREVDMKAYLEEVVTSLSPNLRGTRHVIHVEGPPLIRIITYPGALAQIVTNLVMNSLQHGFASKEAGTVEMRFSFQDDHLALVYQDDGCGMTAAVAAKAFDPFFTTNREKGGTGLGLFIVHNLVTNRLGGTIQMNTSEGNGVRYTILLPSTGKGAGQ
mgnify:CR=1 FL=1